MLAMRICGESVPDPRIIRPDIPPALATLCAQAVAPIPERRPTAWQMAERLNAAANALAVRTISCVEEAKH